MIQVGELQAAPGQIVRGWLDAIQLPTGGFDRFPVVIAQGNSDGPVLWITTGVHGDEHTGLIVLQRLLSSDLLSQLNGTLITVLNLNPGGFRNRSREAYYYRGDPNRRFPDPLQPRSNSARQACLSIDDAYARLFDEIEASRPVALIDLHNAWIGSVPFAFRDPVFYGKRPNDQSKLRTRREADLLSEQNRKLLRAFGFSVVNDYVASSYVSKQLHRSLSGAVLNGLSIPAMTVELGSWMYVEEHIVQAALAGIRNVMRHFGLLDGGPEPLDHIHQLPTNQSVRRLMHPVVPAAGIVDIHVAPGDRISRLQHVATLRDMLGNPLGENNGRLLSNFDGYVLGWPHGVLRYLGEAVLALAVPDDGDMLIPTGS